MLTTLTQLRFSKHTYPRYRCLSQNCDSVSLRYHLPTAATVENARPEP